MAEETPFKLLTFSIEPGCEETILGTVKGTRWRVYTKWTQTSEYYYDFEYLKIIRNGNTEEVEILVNLIQWKKGRSPAHFDEKISAYFTAGQSRIKIIPMCCVNSFDNRDKLKAKLKIFDMPRPCQKTRESSSLHNSVKYAFVEKFYPFPDFDIISSEENKIDPFPQLSEDFACLLNEPKQFSDITLKCGNSEIPVHKCVLSARSPVFAAMFRNQDMQESRSGTVDIVDIEADVLQAMLRYIYSGKVDDLSEMLAGDLLFATDKYELEVLKLICVDKLKNSLSMDNIFRILVLGYLHHEGLKEHTKRFICEQDKFSELEESEEWKSLQKEHPVLAMEVLTSVVKYLKSSS